jgi:hypothetical protein
MRSGQKLEEIRTTALVNAVLAQWQAALSNPVLTVGELADGSARPILSVDCDPETTVKALSAAVP